MKIPEWLPDTHHPVGSEVDPHEPLVDSLLQPVVRFLQIEAAGGGVLLACTLFALVIANTAWADQFAGIWETKVGFTIGQFVLQKSLLHWINDGLMTVFFFVVGLEIKREIVAGELGDLRKAALPAAAALGGMIVPAAIYLSMQHTGPEAKGWGISMATDIAFVVGFLSLLGPRVPLGLKILLLTLAIVDDIGAILVIAIAYTEETSVAFLILGFAGFGLVHLLARIGVRSIFVYVVVGAAIWFALYKSGIHPTVAGVILGLLTPATPWFAEHSLIRVAEGTAAHLRTDRGADVSHHHEEAAQLIADTATETVSPLNRLESALHPWVAFGIMPLFALANAGVKVEFAALTEPVALAVAVALVIGKPLGIVSFSWVAVALGLARLPNGVTWTILLGAGCLAGIGFTMSLFIAGLALEGDPLRAGKIGTLLGSALSAILGMGLLSYFLPASPTEAEAN